MLFGRTDVETIGLNEDSVWSGGFTNRVNPRAREAFPRVRSSLDQGLLQQASADLLRNLTGTPTSPRKYQPAGEMKFKIGHNFNNVTGYNRTLDVATGVQRTQYDYQGTHFERTAIASFPMNVLAFQFKANNPGKINMRISLNRTSGLDYVEAVNGFITIRGFGTDDSAYTFTTALKIVPNGGSMRTEGADVVITAANRVDLYWNAETLFRYPDGRSRYEGVLFRRLDDAAAKGFDGLMTQAISDYQTYYNRARVDLGRSTTAAGRVSTVDRLIKLAQTSDLASDIELVTLNYNYGRYLFISSSRTGSLPPNLQGIWNDNYNPPWGSKYTININLQMNYWHADTNGLTDLQEPLWTHLTRMQTRGKAVASSMYGLRGWVCHHNTDLWGDCAPVDYGTAYAVWPMGAVWMLHHVIEHYRYTRDRNFATSTALPLMTNAMAFMYDFAPVQKGWRTVYPSLSPEHEYGIPGGNGTSTGTDKSTQADRALLRELFQGFLDISQDVGSSTGVADARAFLAQIEPHPISSSTGRLLEWSQDYEDREKGHRHFSPMIGLHPGNAYSPLKNVTLTTAAMNLLKFRMDNGSGSTGWSRVWAAIMYARNFEGDKSMNSLMVLIRSYWYSNLFAKTSSVFQIDANFGLVHLVNELFLQSHLNGLVHLGPAMPTTMATAGSFQGWIARGGYVVDATWSNSQITSATVKAGSDGTLSLRVQNGRQFSVNGVVYTQPIRATSGSVYKITF
ncbi:hypothetical protein CAC42_373 [Sphaceloma murrayae]|uniref:Uncharacterized protein n=1 Tax=Sphaceloma murrayae TaxID=2082308 RepID=A0A2K1R3B7_9PEZI|nr:hypothetical protein CAC42_373 [Sphaceloma murrayae]